MWGGFPRALDSFEGARPGLTELHIVGSMQQRKALIADLVEAIIALPGGFGTLDELSEILTWAQLEMHRNPIGLLNVDGYCDPLLAFVERSVSDGFAVPDHRRLLIAATEPCELLRELGRRRAAGVDGPEHPTRVSV